MEDRNTSKRRTSEEVALAILEYLSKAERAVPINDIALSIGSNSKLVQRWLKLIQTIQNSPNLIIEDRKGSRIRISDEKIQHIDWGIHLISENNFTSIREEIYTWIGETITGVKSFYKGNWRLTSSYESAQLIIFDIADLTKIRDQILDNKPMILSTDFIISNLSIQDLTFFISGFYANTLNLEAKLLPTELLRLISSNLMSGVFSEDEKATFESLMEYLIPLSGTFYQTQNTGIDADEISLYLQNISRIIYTKIDSEDNFDLSSAFWPKLRIIDFQRLDRTQLGKIFMFRIIYFLGYDLSEDRIIEIKELDDESEFWYLLNQYELRKISRDDPRIQLILHKIKNRDSPKSVTLINYASHLLNLEYVNNPNIVESKFLSVLSDISLPLYNLASKARWNWFDLGKIYQIYLTISLEAAPFLKVLIGRKLVYYSRETPFASMIKLETLQKALNFELTLITENHIIEMLKYYFKHDRLDIVIEIIENIKNRISEYGLILKMYILVFKLFFFDLNYVYQNYELITNKNIRSKKAINIANIFNILIQSLNPSSDVIISDITSIKLTKDKENDLSEDPINLVNLTNCNFANEYTALLSTQSFEFDFESRIDLMKCVDKFNFERENLPEMITKICETRFHLAKDSILPGYDYKQILEETLENKERLVSIDDNLCAFIVGSLYQTSIKFPSNSIIRDGYRTMRRELLTKHKKIQFHNKYSIAVLYLRWIDQRENEVDDTTILSEVFPNSDFRDLSVFQILEFLQIREYFRSEYSNLI